MAEASSFKDRGERRPYAGGGSGGGKKPYIGGGNRFDKAGEPRPYESRRTESRNYKGTPRFKREDSPPPSAERSEPAAERSRPPRFSTFESKPAFGSGDKPRFAGKPSFGDQKPAGFKKKFTGKAAGAKGSYKGGKAERAKRGYSGTRD